MNYLLIIIVAIAVSACAHTYPKTGSPGIDLALSNQALSHQTKMNILSKYRGEEPVYEETTPARPPVTAGGYHPVVIPKNAQTATTKPTWSNSKRSVPKTPK